MKSQNYLTGNERYRHYPQTLESSPLALIVTYLFTWVICSWYYCIIYATMQDYTFFICEEVSDKLP